MNSQGSKKSRIYPHTKRIFNTSYPNLKKTHDIRYGVGVYLDYAATTPVDSEVLKAMAPYFSEKFGNTSSVHSYGQEVIAAMDKARESIAKFLNCDWNEIIFTGSATEANNLAIFGIARNFQFSNSNFQINSKFLPSGDLPKGEIWRLKGTEVKSGS